MRAIQLATCGALALGATSARAGCAEQIFDHLDPRPNPWIWLEPHLDPDPTPWADPDPSPWIVVDAHDDIYAHPVETLHLLATGAPAVVEIGITRAPVLAAEVIEVLRGAVGAEEICVVDVHSRIAQDVILIQTRLGDVHIESLAGEVLATAR